MSSADLAHVCWRLVYFVSLVLPLAVASRTLTSCLFPSFKERLLLPVEVTKWANFQALVLPFASPVCDWECKGTKTFWTSKFLSEKSIFSQHLLNSSASDWSGLQMYSKYFLIPARTLKIFFLMRYLSLWYQSYSRSFTDFKISQNPTLSIFPPGRLPFGTAKVGKHLNWASYLIRDNLLSSCKCLIMSNKFFLNPFSLS